MRESEYLRERYAAILSATGFILLLSGGVTATPLALLAAYPEEAQNAPAFLFPAAGLCLSGLLLWRIFRRPDFSLSVQEGGIIVLIGWVVVISASAWPFVSVLGLPFSRALFESVSGWTTTGLSVVDVTRAGRMILFWRSVMQLVGGAGLAIIMMSAIVGPTGAGISSAEGRSDQLVPNVRKSARLVLMIYACYAFVGALAFWLAGMTPFDAVNHAFAAVSTGGFSTRTESIGYWNSTAVEAVAVSLMLLGSLSFVTAWLLWRGKLRLAMRSGELRLMGLCIPLAVAALFLMTCRALYPQLGKSLRVAIFETVSAATTTGFSTVSYAHWNAFGLFVLTLLMLVGGGTCSTAGGIKQFRIYLLWKQSLWELRRTLLPRSVVMERAVWEGDRHTFIDDAKVQHAAVFVFLYLGTCAAGILVLCGCGYSLEGALFEFASALGTVGLSVGITSAQMPDAALWTESLAMFLGRLEIVVVITSLIKMAKDLGRMADRPA